MSKSKNLMIENGKNVVDQEKLNEWQVYVQNTENKYPDFTILVFSLRAITALKEGRSFEDVKKMINGSTSIPNVKVGILNAISRFAANGKKFNDYYHQNQKLT